MVKAKAKAQVVAHDNNEAELVSVVPVIQVLEDLIDIGIREVYETNPELKRLKGSTARYSVFVESRGRKKTLLGRFEPDALRAGKSKVHQITFTSESLGRPIEEIVATGVHESVHMVNNECGICDVSRGGRHNKKFKAPAENVGLIVELSKSSNVGYGHTKPTEELLQRLVEKYEINLDKWQAILNIYKAEKEEIPAAPKEPRNSYICACKPVVWIKGELGTVSNPVICTICNQPFLLKKGFVKEIPVVSVVPKVKKLRKAAATRKSYGQIGLI